MERSADLAHLNTDEWDQLQDLADRFEEAWREGGPVDLNRFLPPPGSPLRNAVLQELVKIDLEMRGRSGQATDLDFYLEKFRDLGTARTLSPQIIYEEYRVRQLYGDKPPLGFYEHRFPDQFEQLRKLVLDQPVAVVTRDSGVPNTVDQIVLPPAEGQSPSPAPPKLESPKAPAGNKKGGGKKEFLEVAGGYKLLKRIGSGGFGEVYRAEAPGGIEAAVKVLFRPVDHAEAQRELQSLDLIKQLRHPFLLQTQAYWASEDRLYIVMELADGSLRDRLKESRKGGKAGEGIIPSDELLRYFREAAEALDFLHSRHVMHRDIKPENILLLQHHAKLADFGLARHQDSQRMVSATGSGTPMYMAPEVWRGKVSPRSDQYSLAMTYAELRLDRRIFQGNDMMQIMFEHLESKPDLQPLPEAEQQVVLRAMDKDSDKRYPSCLEFALALEQAVLGEKPRKRRPETRDDDTTEMEPSVSGVPPQHLKPTSAEGLATLAGTSPLPTLGGRGDRAGLMDTASPGMTASSGDWHIPRTWHGSVTSPLEEVKKPRSWIGWAAALLLLALGSVGAVVVLPHVRTPATPTHSTERAAEVDTLPSGCEKAEGAKILSVGTRKYYDRIVKQKAGQRFSFILIPHTTEQDPPAFYMLETKVSYGQFIAAAKEQDFLDCLDEQVKESKVQGIVQRAWETVPYKKSDRLPITNVTVTEAYCFARWLGGKLPTFAQWNKAAGYNEPNRGKGPYREPWVPEDRLAIALNRNNEEGPLPVGEATNDESIFGCKDMAGNGVEWTRNMDPPDLGFVPCKAPGNLDGVSLRGRSFRNDRPLEFAESRSEAISYEQTDIDISFRVVLEPA